MIHEALTKNEVAKRYYAVTHPERNYEGTQALRQFRQDKSIDMKVLRQVIREIFREQVKMIGRGN